MSNLPALQATLAAYDRSTRLYAFILHNDSPTWATPACWSKSSAPRNNCKALAPATSSCCRDQAHIKLPQLLGKRASLQVSLADGRRTSFIGQRRLTGAIE